MAALTGDKPVIRGETSVINLTQTECDFLDATLVNEYGRDYTLLSIAQLPHQSRAGHPIYILDLSGPRTIRLTLHFRQSTASSIAETDAMARARKNGVLVPSIVYVDHGVLNPFGAPFLIREYVEGEPIAGVPGYLDSHFNDIVSEMLRVHRPDRGIYGPPGVTSVEAVRRVCLAAARGLEDFDAETLGRRFDELREFRLKYARALTISSSGLVHRELHPSKILASASGPVIVNWELATDGDYCEDLAFVHGALTPLSADPDAAWQGIVERYRNELGDDSMPIRLCFYVVKNYLQQIAVAASAAVRTSRIRRLTFALNDYLDNPLAAAWREL